MSFADRVHAVNIACIAHLGEDIPAGHSDAVIYRRNGYPAFELPGILFQPVHDMLSDMSPGTNEKLFLHMDDFRAKAPKGVDKPDSPDEITVRGSKYSVLSPKADEGGGVTLSLRKIL